MGYRVGVASERVIQVPKIGSLHSLLSPSEPAFASLQGSLSIVTRKECQKTDIELFSTGERGDFAGR